MAQRLRTLLEIAAGVAAAALLVLPPALRRDAPAPQVLPAPPAQAATRPARAEGAEAAAPLAAPSRIAALFPAPRGPPTAPPPEQPAPVSAPPPAPDASAEHDDLPRADWLRFVGSATDATGRRVLFFRNLRTGTLERAASPAAEGEWELGAQDDRSVELRARGEGYRVPLR